jgi:hypothetical protein
LPEDRTRYFGFVVSAFAVSVLTFDSGGLAGASAGREVLADRGVSAGREVSADREVSVDREGSVGREEAWEGCGDCAAAGAPGCEDWTAFGWAAAAAGGLESGDETDFGEGGVRAVARVGEPSLPMAAQAVVEAAARTAAPIATVVQRRLLAVALWP